METEVSNMREYLFGIPAYTDKHTLGHTKEFYRLLGISFPQDRIIHVAGTNGKGSVCNYLRELLRSHGKHVVMFTSPHLIRINERFVIDDRQATDRELTEAFDRVLSLTQSLKEREDLYHPTYFEFLFLMLMCLCEKVNPDYLILETGLGGMLDATNIFEKPALTVITRIGMDHCSYLGDTLPAIAGQKAGIIKEKVPLVLQSTGPETDEVILKAAAARSAPALVVDEQNYRIENVGKKSIDFSYQSHYYSIDLQLRGKALYQLKNAATALSALRKLADLKGLRLSDQRIQEAFRRAKWPGRMQQIRENIILDGAHNPDGMEGFLSSVAADGCEGTRILILALSSDKDAASMTDLITSGGLFSKVIVTGYSQMRAFEPERLAAFFDKDTMDVCVAKSPKEALLKAQKQAGKGDLIYIAGSLYLVGEIKELLDAQKDDGEDHD